jgi:hypothetical protein
MMATSHFSREASRVSPLKELIAADPLPSSASETEIALGALTTETDGAGQPGNRFS